MILGYLDEVNEATSLSGIRNGILFLRYAIVE